MMNFQKVDFQVLYKIKLVNFFFIIPKGKRFFEKKTSEPQQNRDSDAKPNYV
jgi:hypothetical protein